MASQTIEDIAQMMKENPEEGRKRLQDFIDKAEADKAWQSKNRIPLSRQRGVDKIPQFNGKGFLGFQKKLVGFAQDEPGCAALLRLVAR